MHEYMQTFLMYWMPISLIWFLFSQWISFLFVIAESISRIICCASEHRSQIISVSSNQHSWFRRLIPSFKRDSHICTFLDNFSCLTVGLFRYRLALHTCSIKPRLEGSKTRSKCRAIWALYKLSSSIWNRMVSDNISLYVCSWILSKLILVFLATSLV